MANRHIKKSDVTGDGLLAFRSICFKCGLNNTAYYIYASPQMRERMRDDYYDHNLSGKFFNCQACYPVHKVSNTAKWLGKVPPHEVDHDLAILGNGEMQIDFAAAEQQATSDVKSEVDYANWQEENKDRIAWARQKA